jgi:hypothetical protein
MPHLFKEFPKVNYDIKKNGKLEVVTNIMLRFKISEAIKSRKVIYYDYNVQDGERPDVIAYKYYGDATLDWVILIVNNVIDPNYDWPLSNHALEKHIIDKYGSLATAHSTVHEYRKILNEQSRLFDGTIIPKRTLVVDQTTYASLSATVKESISKYTYEQELNESKRQIKLIDADFISNIVNQYESVFD